jgi:hypothetical protein
MTSPKPEERRGISDPRNFLRELCPCDAGMGVGSERLGELDPVGVLPVEYRKIGCRNRCVCERSLWLKRWLYCWHR